MKRYIHAAALVMLMLIMFALGALAQDAQDDLIVYAPELICAGGSVKLTTNTSLAIKWRSDDDNIARVNRNGYLVAAKLKKPASVTIYARTERHAEIAFNVTVIPAATDFQLYIGDKRVTSKDYNVDLYTSPATLNITALAKPESAARGIVWSSSDERVARVDENGAVTIYDVGETKIKAQLLNGKSASVTVRASYEPHSLTLEYASADMFVGDTLTLNCVLTPENATNPALRFKSSNTSVARLDADGVVYARAAGRATISVSARNGVSASVDINVYNRVKSLSFPEERVTLGVGEQRSFAVKAAPSNSKSAYLTYESTDQSVAIVNAQGVIYARSEGECVISCVSDNGARAQTNITVKYIQLKDAEFVSDQAALALGARVALPMIYTPHNASSRYIRFESSDESVVSVDVFGNLVATGTGRARVYAYLSESGKALDSVRVRVLSADSPPLTGVRVGINPGHQITRDYTQLPLAPGWKTTGNANSGYVIGVKTRNTEYEINLQIALKLRDALEALGAEVVMTRTQNDVKINNIERAQMLNAADVDISLQIHCNNSDNKNKQGASVFVKSEDKRSAEIAKHLIDNMCKESGAKNIGVRKYDMYMSLNWSETDAALLECGYMSNAEEDVLLGDEAYQYKLVKGLANGFVEFYGKELNGAE